MDRNNLAHLTSLALVARHGSFRRAARELGVSPSAVSHSVSQLEEQLGVRLLARTTRSVAPTEEGARLLERLLPALAEIDGALEAASESRQTVSGNLRLTVPRTGTHLALTRHIAGFALAYPDVTVEIVIDDRFTDMVAGEFDAGVRLGESLQPDMIAVPITAPLRMALVAAPSYLARLAKLPQHPRDLLEHSCIRFRFSSGIVYRWEFEKDGEELQLAVSGPLILDDDRLILQAALEGVGFAFVFEGYVNEALASGALVRLLEDWRPPFPGFHIYYPSRRQMRPALRAFVDFVRWRA